MRRDAGLRLVEAYGDPLDAVGGPADFGQIADPGVEGLIWRRRLPGRVQQWIDALPVNRLPSARVNLAASDIRPVVTQVTDIANLSGGACLEWFVNDVVMIATAFANTMAAAFLRIRFSVVPGGLPPSSRLRPPTEALRFIPVASEQQRERSHMAEGGVVVLCRKRLLFEPRASDASPRGDCSWTTADRPGARMPGPRR